MKSFKCSGCKGRFPFEQGRRLGLKTVCSTECATTVRQHDAEKTRARRAPKDDIPKEVRGAVVVRDRGRCRYCGAASTMLHHIEYRSEGGPHTERNLIVLCTTHHDLVHTSKMTWQPVLQEVIRRLYAGQSVTVPEVQRRWRASS